MLQIYIFPVKNIAVYLLYNLFQGTGQVLVYKIAQRGIAGSLHLIQQPDKPDIHFAQLVAMVV